MKSYSWMVRFGTLLLVLPLAWAQPVLGEDQPKEEKKTGLDAILGDAVRLTSALLLKSTSDTCLDAIEERLKTTEDAVLRSQLNAFLNLRKRLRVYGQDPTLPPKASAPVLLSVSLRKGEAQAEDLVLDLGGSFIAEYAKSPTWVASVLLRELSFQDSIQALAPEKREKATLEALQKKAYALQGRFIATSKLTGDRRAETLLAAFRKGEASAEWLKYVAETPAAAYSPAKENLPEGQRAANVKEFLDALCAKYPALKAFDLEIEN